MTARQDWCKNAIYLIAGYACRIWVFSIIGSISVGLAACAVSVKPAHPDVFDFGPGNTVSRAVPVASKRPPLIVADVESNTALDSTAVLYRLVYADAQQLRPYALAHWSMPPAQLLQQRLREHLGQDRVVLDANGVIAPVATGETAPLTLRITLEEFSQVFGSAQNSHGLLRMRATLFRSSAAGEHVVAQRSVVVQRPAASPDAPGGIHALAVAADAAVQELSDWVNTVP